MLSPQSDTAHILPSALDFSSPSRMCLKAAYLCYHGQGWVSGSRIREKKHVKVFSMNVA